MRTQILCEQDSFDRLRAEWNDLVERSPLRTVFLTWEWQAIWWKRLGEGGLHLITLREDDGTLVGIAPLCRVPSPAGRHTFRWVGCVDVSDYLDVIAAPGYEMALYKAVLDHLTGDNAPHWQYVDLCNIKQASPTYDSMVHLARQRGLHARSSVQEVCPVIPLPATWDAYLDSLDKKQRHEIRRKLRRIESTADTRWRVADDGATLDRDIDDFIRLHRKSNPEKDAFMDEKMMGFFRDICHAFFEYGWLHLAFIHINGTPAATMLNFDYDNSILVYNSGYDPDQYAAFSPGIVLLSLCIRHAIETGKRQFDFLRGDEEYKFRFGAIRTTVHNVLIGHEPLEP